MTSIYQMKILKIAVAVICLLYPQLSFSQYASDSYADFFKQIKTDSVLSFRSPKGYFPSFLHNMGKQAISPFHLSERGWMNTFLVAGVTGTLIHFDEQMDKTFKPVKDKNAFIAKVSPHLTEMGDYYGYMTLAAFGGYSILFHDYKAFRTGLLASQAAISAGLWVRMGKMLTSRMRPGATYIDREYRSDHWFGPFAQFKKSNYDGRGIAGFDAFPSGHTAAAFAMATVFAVQYKNVPVVPVAMYSLAGLVGVTRLFEHEHWASDVFLGGVVGYLCARQVLDTENTLFPHRKAFRKMAIRVNPVYGNGFGGLSITMNPK